MKTATHEMESRLDEHRRRVQYGMLSCYENQRARAIATHYVRNMASAQQILKLLHYSRINEASISADEAIASLVQDIAKNHALDLGIKLEWEETP